MTYIKIFICCLMLFALGIAGCSDTTTGGANTYHCSDFATGGGYSIKLCVSNTVIPQGGQTTLIATVRDANNTPINDSTRGVTFTSSWGMTIATPSPNTISGGVCSTIYTATPVSSTNTLPSSLVDQVTASYQGAIAWVSISVYKP